MLAKSESSVLPSVRISRCITLCIIITLPPAPKPMAEILKRSSYSDSLKQAYIQMK